MTWVPAAIQAAGSIASGYLAGKSGQNKETKMQRTQRKLVDQLLASLMGEGPFSALFASDEDAFRKSFLEPAQAMFKNKIAPSIQQQFVAHGQQRGTGLDDQLLRAGVDLDTMLNQQMYQFQQDAMNRKQSTINAILGQGSGAQKQPSTMENIAGSASGYLSSPAFSDQVANIFKKSKPEPQRAGYETEWNV